jgi:hypothetical protein
MNTDLFIKHYKDEIEAEYVSNWWNMWEAIVAIAKKQYDDACKLAKKVESDKTLKTYLYECAHWRKNPFNV